jgi:hypothetical protein
MERPFNELSQEKLGLGLLPTLNFLSAGLSEKAADSVGNAVSRWLFWREKFFAVASSVISCYAFKSYIEN